MQWEAQPWLSLQTSYTANRIVFDGTDALNGNRVPGVPDQRFSAQATAQRGPVWMRLSWTAVDRYFADNANTARIDGYALTDIRVGLTDTTLGQTTVRPYVEVGNAFDASYIGSVSINANDNFYEPGVGRTVQAGVTVTL
ncbi:TonB-dependent receptor domain-containing protein [Longimonas sp.]|uniref:TonB-dependent receptor domain-containing protein n=1 Tax=Longimonas sp. TaxID=2039626 RepID=UPI003976ED25